MNHFNCFLFLFGVWSHDQLVFDSMTPVIVGEQLDVLSPFHQLMLFEYRHQVLMFYNFTIICCLANFTGLDSKKLVFFLFPFKILGGVLTP